MHNLDTKNLWRLKEKRVRMVGKRGYLHFDFPVKFSQKSDQVSEPNWVEHHSFYPFLYGIIETPRYRTDDKTKRRVRKPKKRDIYYASHLDSLVYSWYATILGIHYENRIAQNPFANSILAYRSLGRNNVHFAKDAFSQIKQLGDCVSLAFDISSFFDNLDHQILKTEWCKVLNAKTLPSDHYKVFRSITRFASINKMEVFRLLEIDQASFDRWKICSADQFRKIVRKSGLIEVNTKRKGIPQGSPISAILSNIYMLSIDELIYNFATSIEGVYRRYSDDMLIVCPISKQAEVEEFMSRIIQRIKLEINPQKTDVTYFKTISKGQIQGQTHSGKPKHMQYLGVEFDGERFFIRSSSLSRYHRKMKANAREVTRRAHGNNSKGKKVWKRKLYSQFTHMGRRNFPGYVYRASEILESRSCRKQIKGHLEKLNLVLRDADQKWALKKHRVHMVRIEHLTPEELENFQMLPNALVKVIGKYWLRDFQFGQHRET